MSKFLPAQNRLTIVFSTGDIYDVLFEKLMCQWYLMPTRQELLRYHLDTEPVSSIEAWKPDRLLWFGRDTHPILTTITWYQNKAMRGWIDVQVRFEGNYWDAGLADIESIALFGHLCFTGMQEKHRDSAYYISGLNP